MNGYRCKLNGVMFENPTTDDILAMGYTQEDAERIVNKIVMHYTASLELEAKWRNQEIMRTDFVFLPDTPFNEQQMEAMKEYRKQLRDYPRQCDIPYSRPVKPSFFK